VAQVHYASRLPRIAAKQDYLGEFYIRFEATEEKNVIEITGLM